MLEQCLSVYIIKVWSSIESQRCPIIYGAFLQLLRVYHFQIFHYIQQVFSYANLLNLVQKFKAFIYPVQLSAQSITLLSLINVTIFIFSRNNILKKLDDFVYHSQTVEKYRRQTTEKTHLLTSIELDILRCGQSLQKFEHEYRSNQNEKMSLLVDIECKELQLECLGRKLVECYKYTVSQIDKIRLQMMELQDHQLLKPLQSVFSFRKAVLMFLRDNLLIKHNYQYGLQLQISAEKRADQFKQFIISLVKKIGCESQAGLLEIVIQYAQLLKKAEVALLKTNSDKLTSKDQQEREQLILATSRLKLELMESQARLNELYQTCSKLSKKISHLGQKLENRQEDKREIQLRLSMLKEKIRCLQVNNFKEEDLKQQLLEVNQAIDYLNSRKTTLANSKIEINSSVNLLPQRQLFSPSSSTSLPQLRDSKGMKLNNMASSISIKPSSKKLVLDRSKMRGKISSPSAWK